MDYANGKNHVSEPCMLVLVGAALRISTASMRHVCEESAVSNRVSNHRGETIICRRPGSETGPRKLGFSCQGTEPRWLSAEILTCLLAGLAGQHREHPSWELWAREHRMTTCPCPRLRFRRLPAFNTQTHVLQIQVARCAGGRGASGTDSQLGLKRWCPASVQGKEEGGAQKLSREKNFIDKPVFSCGRPTCPRHPGAAQTLHPSGAGRAAPPSTPAGKLSAAGEPRVPLSRPAGWERLRGDVGGGGGGQEPAPRDAGGPSAHTATGTESGPQRRWAKTRLAPGARQRPPRRRPRMWGSRPSVPSLSVHRRRRIPCPARPASSLQELPAPSLAAPERGPLCSPARGRAQAGAPRCRNEAAAAAAAAAPGGRGGVGRGQGGQGTAPLAGSGLSTSSPSLFSPPAPQPQVREGGAGAASPAPQVSSTPDLPGEVGEVSTACHSLP